MSNEITLDSIVLNQMGSYGKSEFENLLKVLCDDVTDKFGFQNEESFEKAKQAEGIALKFAAIYLAISSELSAQLSFIGKKEELTNVVSAYTASQAVRQMNEDEYSSAVIENKSIPRKNPDLSKVDFKRMDTSVIGSILREYRNFIVNGPDYFNLVSETNFFFYCLSNLALGSLSKREYTKHQDFLEKLVVKGPGFKIEGIKKQSPSEKKKKAFLNGEEQFQKDFDRITLTPDKKVYRQQIVGNLEAINKLESAVKKLLAYRKVDRTNPYLEGRTKKGFKQGLLLIGDTGTGKTLVSFYGMTLADKIAKDYGKNLKLVKFNIDSSYQEGGVLMLKNQLNQVCKGDQTYYIFLDEIDTIFASRSDSAANSQYHRQKLGELMRFLEGDYPNLGNYLVVAAANDTQAVDRALKNARLERVYCPGPLTPEEKARVLAIHFGEDLKKGKVQIENWRKIGQLAHQTRLDGRKLRDIVSNCYDQALTFSDHDYAAIYQAPSLRECQKIISDNLAIITEEIILEQIIRYGKKDLEEKKVASQFHQ